eukprot:ctg_858.g377
MGGLVTNTQEVRCTGGAESRRTFVVDDGTATITAVVPDCQSASPKTGDWVRAVGWPARRRTRTSLPLLDEEGVAPQLVLWVVEWEAVTDANLEIGYELHQQAFYEVCWAGERLRRPCLQALLMEVLLTPAVAEAKNPSELRTTSRLLIQVSELIQRCRRAVECMGTSGVEVSGSPSILPQGDWETAVEDALTRLQERWLIYRDADGKVGVL